MGAIQKADLGVELIRRLNSNLQKSRELEFNTTNALANFTTLVCWIVQRARRQEQTAQALWSHWDSISATAEPWQLPHAFDGLTVAGALRELRNALAHADDSSAEPVNGAVWDYAQEQLIGFVVTSYVGEVTLLEDDLYRIGNQLTREYLNALGKGERGQI